MSQKIEIGSAIKFNATGTAWSPITLNKKGIILGRLNEIDNVYKIKFCDDNVLQQLVELDHSTCRITTEEIEGGYIYFSSVWFEVIYNDAELKLFECLTI